MSSQGAGDPGAFVFCAAARLARTTGPLLARCDNRARNGLGVDGFGLAPGRIGGCHRRRGGGLILVPALFTILPTTHPATLFGINKSASLWGTAIAAVHLGHDHAPRLHGPAEALVAAGIGLVLGFCDGFFGPGTGSFLVFLFVRLLGYDFLHASASSKLVNSATNLAALTPFAFKGHVRWHYALALAVANVIGSLLGTRLALRRGAAFVGVVFLRIVTALILKTGYDVFLR
jgi:uncharacterized membrane protein YfcA